MQTFLIENGIVSESNLEQNKNYWCTCASEDIIALA